MIAATNNTSLRQRLVSLVRVLLLSVSLTFPIALVKSTICDLVFPKYGDSFPVRDASTTISIYVLISCQFGRNHANLLQRNKYFVQFVTDVVDFDDNIGDYVAVFGELVVNR